MPPPVQVLRIRTVVDDQARKFPPCAEAELSVLACSVSLTRSRMCALVLLTLMPPPLLFALFCVIVELRMTLVGAPEGPRLMPPPLLSGAELPATSVRSIVSTAPCESPPPLPVVAVLPTIALSRIVRGTEE